MKCIASSTSAASRFLKWALLFLFVANFSWIALSFAASVVGFLHLLFVRPKPPALPDRLAARAAVVMPIYNEAPARVFGALQAIYEDVEATGHGAAFDWFFLSDTTDPDIWIAEERAFVAMRGRLGPQARIYYRHRAEKHRAQGRQYRRFRHPLGRRLRAYGRARRRQPDDRATPSSRSPPRWRPIPTPASSRPCRSSSTATRCSPACSNSPPASMARSSPRPAVWMGRDGNYWGHNAIIRTAAFAAHCGLPAPAAASRRSAATSSATISSRRR